MEEEAKPAEVRVQDTNQIKLIEYQKTQDSAEHHSQMNWLIRSVLWAGSFALLGFASHRVYPKADEWEAILVTLLGVVGILALIAVQLWSWQCGRAIRVQYKRCQEIEELLGMWNHLGVAKVWREHLGSRLTVAGTLILMFAWLAIIALAWALRDLPHLAP